MRVVLTSHEHHPGHHFGCNGWIARVTPVGVFFDDFCGLQGRWGPRSLFTRWKSRVQIPPRPLENKVDLGRPCFVKHHLPRLIALRNLGTSFGTRELGSVACGRGVVPCPDEIRDRRLPGFGMRRLDAVDEELPEARDHLARRRVRDAGAYQISSFPDLPDSGHLRRCHPLSAASDPSLVHVVRLFQSEAHSEDPRRSYQAGHL